MTPWLTTTRPTASHLSTEACRALRALLVAEQRTNAEQAVAHQLTARELAGQTDTDSIIERELAEAGAARCREAIEEAELALKRLDAGTFGWCEACGAVIELERLQAVPAARFCVACPGRRLGFDRLRARVGAAQGSGGVLGRASTERSVDRVEGRPA